jgi:hypothetical protein
MKKGRVGAFLADVATHQESPLLAEQRMLVIKSDILLSKLYRPLNKLYANRLESTRSRRSLREAT